MTDQSPFARLSPMRFAFLWHLVGLASHDPVAACRAAGYSARGDSLKVMAWRLIHERDVRAALPHMIIARQGKPGFSAAGLDHFLDPALPLAKDMRPDPPERKARVARIVAAAAEVGAQRRARMRRDPVWARRAREVRYRKRDAAGLVTNGAEQWTALPPAHRG